MPLAPTCGLLAVSSPLAEGVSRVVHVPGMNFRPDPGGGAVLQSGATDGTVSADTPPDPALPGCATLLEAVARYLPALAGARIVEARVGVRPMPADGFTLAGAVEARPGLYLTVTHSGVTLGPLLGELAVRPRWCGWSPCSPPSARSAWCAPCTRSIARNVASGVAGVSRRTPVAAGPGGPNAATASRIASRTQIAAASAARRRPCCRG